MKGGCSGRMRPPKGTKGSLAEVATATFLFAKKHGENGRDSI